MVVHLDRGEEDLAETHEINVTPFIDVMLVLLIIFMVAAPLASVEIDVDLPASTTDERPRPAKPIFLTVQSDLTLALGDTEVERSTLATALDEAAGGDKERRVFLRADRSVSYGDVMNVMNELRAAGYLKVALVAVEELAAE